jgi:hypothetical protein
LAKNFHTRFAVDYNCFQWIRCNFLLFARAILPPVWSAFDSTEISKNKCALQ